jgi:CDP-diacylglycerol--glycerol-3-phosphate 3-phosphatidyltransferase
MAAKGLRDLVAVAWVGKLKTTLQMIAITLLLGASPSVMPLFFHLGLTLIWVAAALGLWSMVSYFRAARSEMFSGE